MDARAVSQCPERGPNHTAGAGRREGRCSPGCVRRLNAVQSSPPQALRKANRCVQALPGMTRSMAMSRAGARVVSGPGSGWRSAAWLLCSSSRPATASGCWHLLGETLPGIVCSDRTCARHSLPPLGRKAVPGAPGTQSARAGRGRRPPAGRGARDQVMIRSTWRGSL